MLLHDDESETDSYYYYTHYDHNPMLNHSNNLNPSANNGNFFINTIDSNKDCQYPPPQQLTGYPFWNLTGETVIGDTCNNNTNNSHLTMLTHDNFMSNHLAAVASSLPAPHFHQHYQNQQQQSILQQQQQQQQQLLTFMLQLSPPNNSVASNPTATTTTSVNANTNNYMDLTPLWQVQPQQAVAIQHPQSQLHPQPSPSSSTQFLQQHFYQDNPCLVFMA